MLGRSKPALAIFVLIALAHAGLRLHALAAFPGFVDEGNHVDWARAMWAGQYWLYPLAHGRLLSIAYLALFWPFTASLWVARAATVLASLITLASIYRLGLTLFGNHWLAGTAAALYAALPFAFFHERLALTDGPAAALVMLSALCLVSMARRPKPRQTLLTGAALAATALTKLTAAGLLGMPWVAAWIWKPPRDDRRRALLDSSAVVALAVALAGLAYLTPFWRYGVLGLPPAQAVAGPAEMATRLAVNSSDLVRWLAGYGGWPLLPGLVVGLVLALAGRRGALFLASMVAVLWLPTIALVPAPYPRYYLVGVPPAVLLSAYGVFEAARLGMRRLERGRPATSQAAPWISAGLIAFGLWGGAQFVLTDYSRPGRLPLPAIDRYEYLEAAWGTGYGYGEAFELICGLKAENTGSLVYSADQQVHWRALLYFPCRAPSARLYQLSQASAPDLGESVRSGAPVYLLWDDPRRAPSFADRGIQLELLKAYVRSGGNSRLEVYRLEWLQ